MSEDRTNPELSALVEDLKANRIDRRAFLNRAAATGITMAAASALATDVLAAPSGPNAMSETAAPPARSRTVVSNIDVQIPDDFRLTQNDLNELSQDFEAKLIEFIKRHGGRAESKPITKVQSVSEEQAIKIDVN